VRPTTPTLTPARSRAPWITTSVCSECSVTATRVWAAHPALARYQKRLVSDVSVKGPKFHDDIGIEAGLDFVHYSWSVPGYPQYSWSYNEVSAVAGVVWNFWIGDKFAVYPKLELAYGFGSGSSYAGVASPSYGGLWFQGAGGVVYKVGPVALRGEAGWRAVRLGAGLAF
jgi:hypothetical protein